MGAEPRRDHVDRPLPTEPVGDVHEAQLGLEVQAVAGFGLDRRDAVAEHLVEPAPAVGQQVRLAGRARRRDGREDPATRSEDRRDTTRPPGA